MAGKNKRRRGLTSIACLLSLLPLLVFPQAPDLAKLQTRSGKVQAMLDYCDLLRLNTAGDQQNFVKLQDAAQTGLSFSDSREHVNRARFFFYLALGKYYQVKFDSAQYCFYQSLEEAQKGHSTPQIVKACVALVQASFQLQLKEKVEDFKNILQSVADTTRDTALEEDIFYALGSYYQQKTYYSTAQDYFIKSLQLREREVDTTTNAKRKFDFAIQCDMLSKLYLNTDMADKSLGALRQGQRFASVSPTVENRLLSSFVEAFATSDRIDSALYYNRRLEVNTKNNATFPSELISSDLNIAIYYMNKSRYQDALPFLDKADRIVKQVQQPMMTFQSQMLRGRYLEETGHYDQSVALLTSALSVARQFNKALSADILKYLALDQKGKGDDNSALAYYESYTGLLDTLTREKASRTFADLETHYQTHQKEAQIQTLDNKNRITSLELKETTHQRLLLIVGLAALGIISLLLYFIYRNKEKLNQTLNEQNDRLDNLNHKLAAANETKARLFGIIGHDLRSPIGKIVQLLQWQKLSPDRLTGTTVQQHQDRLKIASENLLETMEDLLLWSKSQMEQFAPQQTPVNIKKLIDREIGFVKEQYESAVLSIDAPIPEDFVQTTDENFLAIIVRNLLQNAIRYGDPSEPVRITASAGALIISNRSKEVLSDFLNEKIRAGRVNSNVSGLGLQIAADLAAKMKSRLSFRTTGDRRLEALLEWQS